MKDDTFKIPTKENTKKNTDIEYESTVESTNDSIMLKCIAGLLNEIVNDNSEDGVMEFSKKPMIIFTAKKPPSISILAYLERILKYCKLEDSTMVVALILIDRLCDMNNFQMNKNNIHR